jgi:exonuclease III
VATYVANNLPVNDFSDSDQLNIKTQIKVRGRSLNIINVYYPEGVRSPTDTDWLRQLEVGDTEWVILGDFNAHHTNWGGCRYRD